MRKIPDRDSVRADDPLRLETAAALAFPDGSMTASGLRSEAAKGRLATEKIAGRIYTTLQAIGEMRTLCRTEAMSNQGAALIRSVSRPDKDANDLRAAKAAALIAAERIRARTRR